jgi:hypothetical protein
MNTIPEQIRTKLKRLCPYVGPYIPETVKEKAKQFWPSSRPEQGTWQWDEDSDTLQWEIDLWNMDDDHIDPEGYVAIRPLEHGKYALIFVIDEEWPEGFDPGNLVFSSIEQAKHYLDTLLAADTPEIPIGA